MRAPKCNIVERTKFSLSNQVIWRRASLLLALTLVVASCGRDSGKMVPLLPNGVANLVIIYKKDVTDEQIEYFLNNVLAHPRADGRGYESLSAIGLRARERDMLGYNATVIAYHSYATSGQREEVKRAALSSPIVYKIFEDVVPSQIKKIE